MQADNSRPASGRWTTRDILTFVVFNLVIVFLTMAAKMIEDMLLAPQNTFFVGSWLFPLLSTPFYVAMADRVGKRGVLAASILVIGVLYTLMGGLYCAPVAVVGAEPKTVAAQRDDAVLYEAFVAERVVEDEDRRHQRWQMVRCQQRPPPRH